MSEPSDESAARPERNPRDPEAWRIRPIEKYRTGRRAYDYRPGPAFFELADPVVRRKQTLLRYDALYVFWQVIHNLTAVPGQIAEIGAYRGGSAFFIASVCAAAIAGDVPFDVFDTFEGHPENAVSEHDPDQNVGHFNATSYDDVRAYLSRFAQVRVHKGDILTLLPGLGEAQYRLVHIDTDLYLPTKRCLEYFGPRLSSNGVFVLDDYGSGKCEGVRTAVHEYLQETDAFQVWDMRTEQLLLVKR
jgi:macrocin-O-methyltransferase TylF-like protien